MANATAVFSPGQRLVDETGTPYSGCAIYFFEAGTTTEKIVYADSELTTQLGATVYTDSAGYPVTSSGSSTKTLVYTNTDAYKITITSNAVTIAEHDNVKGAVISTTGSGESFLTQDAADVRYMRNPNALASTTSLTSGDKIGYFNAAAAGNRYIDWDDLTADLLGEWRTAGYIFSAGARVVFQSAPPTGWTLETASAYNNVGLRFTTGTPGTGGSVAFDTLFTSQTLTGTIGSDTPSISKTAAHDHDVPMRQDDGTFDAGAGYGTARDATTAGNPATTTSVGSGTSHNHSLTMNAFNCALKYASVNIGQKA
ncbi:MAG: hypothetical protein IPL32_18665 [Chloracidobacterium sp.]|nr:hypothetical protein [Chloracidobacterium sp.]